MEAPLHSRLFAAPFGELLLIGSAAGLRAVVFTAGRELGALRHAWALETGQVVLDEPSPLLARASRELRQYFAGQRREFTVSLDVVGTPFQRHVWDVLGRLPYGTTTTYTALAERVGRPRAVRAVAHACARNPLPIVVPCHRVVGRDGGLTGYLGGLPVKRRLLALEGVGEAEVPPLLRLVDDAGAPEPVPAAGDPPALSDDALPAGLARWLEAPNRRGLAPDQWLAEFVDRVGPERWPAAAERLFAARTEADRGLGDILLEAWAQEIHGRWPEPSVLARFLAVAADRPGPYFELVVRRLLEEPRLPGELRGVVGAQLEGIMAGQLPASAHHREVAVDLWLALDPEAHEAALVGLRAALGLSPASPVDDDEGFGE